MDVRWLAAFGLGMALLLAGTALLVYEKFWRHRYRGPYSALDVATRSIDETAIQPKAAPQAQPPRAAGFNWPPRITLKQYFKSTNLNRNGKPKRNPKPKRARPVLTRSRTMKALPVGLVVFLLLATSGTFLVTRRAESSPPPPPGSVVVAIAEFVGAPPGNNISANFSSSLLNAAPALGANNIVVRESRKRPTDSEQAGAERARLQAHFLWWGEVGAGGSLTVSLSIDPLFAATQNRWQRFAEPDLGVLLFPAYASMTLPAGAGTEPLVPLSLALAQFKSGNYGAAARAATGARAIFEDKGISGEFALFTEATVVIAAGDTAKGTALFETMDGAGKLTSEGLTNRAAARLYTSNMVGARADADRVIADREAGDVTRSRAYLIRARTRNFQGELAQAQVDLDESLRLDPSYIRAQLDLAEVFYKQAQPEKARVKLDELIRKAPDAAPAFRLLGLVRLMLAQPEEALKTLSRASEVYEGWIAGLRQEEAQAQVTGDKARSGLATDSIVQLNRELSSVRLYEGMAWADLARAEPPETFLGGVWRTLRGEPSKYERALAKLEEARRLDTQRPDIILQLGSIYSQMGNTAKAVEILQQAQALDPTAPEPYFALASLYQRAGLSQDAVRVLNSLITNSPRSYRAYEELSRVYATEGDKVSATTTLQTALNIIPKAAQDYLWRGKFYRALGDNEQAEAQFRSAAGDPQLWEARLYLGQLYAQAGRGPEALSEFRLVLESQPNSPDALLGAARQLSLAGQSTEADKLFGRLTALSPGNVDAHIAYLQLLLAMRRVDDAIAEGRKAVAADSKRADAHFFLGEALEVKKQWGAASKEYQAAADRDPMMFEAFIRVARTLFYEDRYVESIQAGQSAIKLRPTDPQPYRWKAEAELALLDNGAALTSVAAALQLRPGYVDALSIGSRAASILGDDRAAVDYANQAIQSEPRNILGHLALGEAHLAQGRSAEAASAFEAALQIIPGDPRALVGKGRAENATGRREAALKLFQDALEADPLSAEAYLYAGLTSVELGRWDGAFTQYRQAAEMRPRWPEALYQLGRAYLQRKDLPNAQGAFLKATEYSPNYVEAWFYLGLTNRDRGRPQEAINALRKAAQLNGNYAEAWLYLGLTLEETGERAQAAEAFTRARDAATDTAIRTQAEQGLLRVR